MIETQRLTIRLASREEMEAIIASQTDPALRAAYTEMLEGCLAHPAQWEWYGVWVIERKDGIAVGDLSFKGLDADGVPEIGYGIAETHWHHGYATEAVQALTAWALQQDGVVRIEAETEPDNKASQRVLEKCGFVPTGIMGEEGPRFALACGKEGD